MQQQLQRNKYLEASIQSATPAQLLVMLYDGAIRNCRFAIESLKSNKYDETNKYLTKAQEIISEFILTLDRTAPISESLLQLYEYFNHRLLQANLSKTSEPVQEVLDYLVQLKETWMEAAKKTTVSNGVKNG